MTDPSPPPPTQGAPSGRAATVVGAGILLSRLVGLVRQKVFAAYFGSGGEADAWSAAFRIPNILQNLFGEGVLSASFIPEYARLRAHGDDEGRRELAGAVLGLLSLLTAVVVLVGVFTASWWVDAIAPGFEGERRALTIQLVRILFPGTGILVITAWCLGVLNAHGKFFLSYAAPVIWNVAMIVTLLAFGGRTDLPDLAVRLAWGSVAGAVLQLAVQWPVVTRLLGDWHISRTRRAGPVRAVFANFVPVFIARGVGQISAYVDSFISSLLVEGSVVTLTYAQALYMLPVSLFGMSVTASELPAMASVTGTRDEVATRLRSRLSTGLRRIAFFVVPSAVAFLALGDLVATVVYRGGEFGADEAIWVWGVLAGSTVGLLSSTSGRLFGSALYALGDTRTPLRFAIVRVVLGSTLGLCFALWLIPSLGVNPRWAVAGLTIGSGMAGWAEFVLLRRAVTRRIGAAPLHVPATLTFLACAAGGALAAWGVRTLLPGSRPIALALLCLVVYTLTYGGLTLALGVPEARAVLARLCRRRGG